MTPVGGRALRERRIEAARSIRADRGDITVGTDRSGSGDAHLRVASEASRRRR